MIPEELLGLRQWVAWRFEERNGRRTKVPLDPHRHNKRASSTDPETWGTYHEAIVAYRPSPNLGFVFSPDDPYVGIDMDLCISPRGLLHRAANDVLRYLDGYHEVSPSDRGIHVITRGSIERGRHTLKTEWDNEFAIYDRGRFFTMRGDGSGSIGESQAGIDHLLAHYFPPEEPRVNAPVGPRAAVCDTDLGVLDRIYADARIARLWAGDTSDFGDDHSAADLALCAHLAFFCGDDFGRIDSLFRASGLMRDKWDQPRGGSTYGRLTIERAMKGA